MAKRRRSIQLKIVMAMLSAGVLPGLVGVYYTYVTATTALKESIGTNFQAIATDTAEKIDMIIDREIFLANSLALWILTDIKTGTPSMIPTHIQRDFSKRSEHIFSIIAADRDGRVIASEGHPLSQQSAETLWKGIPENARVGAFAGNVRFDEADREYFMMIAVPVMDERPAQYFGNILVLYKVSEIFKTISNVSIGKTGHANLVTADGTLLACPIYQPMSHVIRNDLLRQVSSPGPGWGIAADDAHGGENAIIGYAPVRTTLRMGGDNFGGEGWYVFVRQLPAETYAPIYAMLWRISVLGLMLIGLLSLAGYLVARRIVKPIRILSEGAHLIGKGNLQHHLDIRTNDEIEDLAGIFNQMAEDLDARFHEIQLERQRLLNSERLAALTQFSSTFAHDLRNPIIAVKKTLEMLKDSYTTPSEVTIRGVYADLISTCGLLLGLVNDVLDVHQVSYRDLPILYSSFSLNQALREAVQLLHIEAEEKRVQILMMDEDRDIWLEGDRRRIQRVFINLLSNALRYSPSDGNIRIYFDTADHYLLLRIEDEGPGIPPDALPKIFDLFYRSDSMGIKSGIVMGLYFCKVVIEAHGGRIRVENRNFTGAAMIIEMPLSRREVNVYQDTHSR